MLLDIDDCQLVLVDYQGRLMPAIHGGQGATARAVFLGRVAQTLGMPKRLASLAAPRTSASAPTTSSTRPLMR